MLKLGILVFDFMFWFEIVCFYLCSHNNWKQDLEYENLWLTKEQLKGL